MHLSSYSDIFHERGHGEEILPGDLVRTGANHYPHFEVIAVSGDQDVSDGSDHLTALCRCRKITRCPGSSSPPNDRPGAPACA